MGQWAGFLLFAVLSAAGWKVFERIGVPAAPVLGGMAFVMAASLLALPLYLPSWMRLVMSVTLGISIGSRPRIRISRKGVGMALGFILLVVCGSLAIGCAVFHMGIPFQTALFASLLGGLNEMVFIAQEFEIDSFQVILFQTARMCLLLAVIPMLARRLPGPIRPPSEDREEAASPTGLDWGVMILFSAVLGCLLNGLHVPAGRLLGAAAFTAVYTRARRLKPRLHPVWHNAVLSSIGGSAGLNVTAASLLSLPALIVPLTGYLCLTASAVAAAYFLLRTFGGYDPLTALFSASMGGLSPSIAAADAMGADTATVTVFQILRYFSVVILALTLGYLL